MKRRGISGGEALKIIWIERREQVQNSYHPPLGDPGYLLGLALYWGEGTKYSHSEVSMTNSDPVILKTFVAWIKQFFDFHSFKIRVQHHNPQDDLTIRTFWASFLGIDDFEKSNYLRRGSNRKNILPNGIARVKLSGKGSWEVRQKIEKGLNVLKNFLENREPFFDADRL